MLRIINCTKSSKKVLQKEQLQWKSYKNLHLNAGGLTVFRGQSRRDYSQGPPPREKSGGGGAVLFSVGALTLIGGGTLCYAKYDGDFRKTMTSYLPFMDNVMKTVFFEDSKTLSKFTDGLKNPLGSLKSLYSSEPESSDKASEVKEKLYIAPLPTSPPLEKPASIIKEKKVEDKVTKPEPIITIAKEDKPKRTLPSSNDSVQDLELNLNDSATDAVNAYRQAINVVRQYNGEISRLLDEGVNQLKPSFWDSIRLKTRNKNESIANATGKADLAAKHVQSLKAFLEKKAFTASEEDRQEIRNNVAKVQQDIAKAKHELHEEIRLGSVTEKYWHRVEEARQHFGDELQILFPSIDISQKKLVVSEEELDLFILHCYSTILTYQRDLARLDTVMQEQVKQAVEAAKEGDATPLTKAQICDAFEQERRNLTRCFQQQILSIKKESETTLREQMKSQMQAFADHLSDAVKTREAEIERILARKYDDLLEQERSVFKEKLASVVGRLQGLDHALKAKADADESSKRSQVLWSACQALLQALRAGCPGMPWNSQMRPLNDELHAVEKAAGAHDDLVKVVLNSVPKEACERGVFPEDALRERFLKVEEVARSVALIPEEGAALPVHVLSKIQGLLLVRQANAISEAELNDEKVDFSSLNTNDILQRARYWLDRGDFAQALKYMNLLKGAPRSIAKQWMVETRIFLETQQAANTLMAHAAASGLRYL